MESEKGFCYCHQWMPLASLPNSDNSINCFVFSSKQLNNGLFLLISNHEIDQRKLIRTHALSGKKKQFILNAFDQFLEASQLGGYVYTW